MTLRSNGSYLGPRPAGPSTSVASGIWDLRTAERQRRSNQWPVVGDPLFGNVSLLLHMDGSGSTFVDSSAYGQTVTANGDVTQSTTQSKFGGKAAYFDGSGDYLSTAAISANTLGSGDFAIEFWCYANAIGGNTCLIDQQSGLLIRQNSGNQLALYDRVTETHFYSGNNALASGQWQHIAIARTGTTLNAYVDGVRVITGTLATNLTGNAFRIGAFIDNSNSGYVLNGYIDELRITKGNDRGYTGSTITVPTAAFPNS